MRDLAKLAGRVAALLPLALLTVGINLFIDPARLFDGGRTERAIADALSSGSRITGLANVDERGLQRELAMRARRAPAILVLGSSRVMTLGAKELASADVRNAGVSGATLCDVLGEYELYRQKGTLPRAVVLGVDPWMLNAQAGDARWVRLSSECGAMRARIGLPAPSASIVRRATMSRLSNVVSLDYFQAGIHELLAHRGSAPAFSITSSDTNAGLTRRPNGSIVYGEDLRRLTPAEVDRSATEYASASPMYQLGGFTRIDPEDSVTFDRFVHRVGDDGITLTLFLPPYHPIAYGVIERDPRYAMVPRAEALVRQLARRAGVRVCGSYDPAAIGMTANDFLDGMHARPPALERLFRSCATP